MKIWLDIRQILLFDPIMEACFDGFEPDNINGYINETGFYLTEANAIAYSRYLITQAHSLKLEYWSKKHRRTAF
ncbi:endo alpha-1,4 polygalactosaminidase [Patiriisocius sp. Uisw_017]|uniref:endo alpha-1,4 polygalactosaminidase n=1 Tax=Patiriisocius sp. Uisw_017 TaxID=3230968 RepID=UPI0039E75FF1